MLLIRVVAAMLAILSVAPLWRILPARATGLAGFATAQAAASYSALVWNGVLLALIPALLAAFLLDSRRMESKLESWLSLLTRARSVRYAFTLAIIATLLSSFVAISIMAARPTLIDSFAQLLQARYMAAGHLAGPVLPVQQAWQIQQTIPTPNGWVSQYPPGYIALLAIGFVLHCVALVGPILLGVAVFFTSLIADEISDNLAVARSAALLAAVSPFMLGMAGAFMSHVPACAFSCATLYFVLRARRDHVLRWSLLAGLCIGALFAIRPLTGIIAAIVALVYVWSSGMPSPAKLRGSAVALLGALPCLLAVAFYNAHFFGSATTFGYTAALGPHAGLGFGTDPWGNRFGPVESLAYTSAELTALSLFLLEVPLPLTLFIGVYFLLERARATPPAQHLVFVWCAALLIANFFYWHHGLFMGPRMLADVGTLWVVLAVVSACGLIARIRHDWQIAGKYSVRAFAEGGALAMLLIGVVLFGTERLSSYAPPPGEIALLRAPQVAKPSLVFVHGGWTARVAMRLAGHGMRLDSIETALRQNGTCSAHHFSLAYANHQKLPPLTFASQPTRPTQAILLAPGDRMRVAPGERIDSECAREMAADSAGIVDVSPFVWQGDLPGLSQGGALFVRDMGPAENAQVLQLYRDRDPLMLVEKDGVVTLQPYADAERARWGAAQ